MRGPKWAESPIPPSYTNQEGYLERHSWRIRYKDLEKVSEESGKRDEEGESER